MSVPDECFMRHAKQLFTVSEKRSEVRFVNNEQHAVEEIVVDKCAINDNGIRCDRLINIPSIGISVFVEFKGHDIGHAFNQLKRSHTLLASVRYPQVYWIVSSQRCPLTSGEIGKKVREIRAETGARLIVRNSPVTLIVNSTSIQLA